jgi:hypothetical protein
LFCAFVLRVCFAHRVFAHDELRPGGHHMRRISVIQPLPFPSPAAFGARTHAETHARTGGLLLMAWVSACVSGCAAAPSPEPAAPTTQSAHAPRRFVPPFAYEAYMRGELALAAGRPQEAALQLEMATAAPDEDAYLLSRLAEAQAQSGEHALAVQTLAEAERVEPCAESVWLTRGAWAERDKQLQAAAASYRTAAECAPRSQAGAVALARVLRAQGHTAESLSLLAQGSSLPQRTALRLTLSRELAGADAAEARFALESWSGLAAIDLGLLEEAAAQAIARPAPLLALRLRELGGERLSPGLQAELARLVEDREALAALLTLHQEQALGGATRAARYALLARDFERAELYANLPATGAESEQHALKVAALQGLGEHEAALDELRELHDPGEQRRLALAQLARLGLAELSTELATH